MDRVLEFATAELAENGPVAFNLDRVIETSGVSRGSIYHHFGSKAGVITAAEAMDLLKAYHDGNLATRQIVERASSGDELIEWVGLAVQMGSGEQGRRARARRIATIAAAEQIPALREVLTDAQRSGVAYYAETLRRAVERGLIAPTMPVLAIANVIQSLLVGRTVIDVLGDVDQESEWCDAVVSLIATMLKPVPSGR